MNIVALDIVGHLNTSHAQPTIERSIIQIGYMQIATIYYVSMHICGYVCMYFKYTFPDYFDTVTK